MQGSVKACDIASLFQLLVFCQESTTLLVTTSFGVRYWESIQKQMRSTLEMCRFGSPDYHLSPTLLVTTSFDVAGLREAAMQAMSKVNVD